MDLFDPKPELTRWNGKDYPHGDLEVHFDKQAGNVVPLSEAMRTTAVQQSSPQATQPLQSQPTQASGVR